METLFLFIIKSCFFISVVAGIFLLWAAPREKRLREAEELAQRQKEEKESAARTAFLEKYMSGWNYVEARINGDVGYVAMADNGLLMRYATYNRWKDDFPLIAEKTFAVASILSFDVAKPQKTKTITHTEKVPVAVKQKRSTVGRAAVGGVLLGPVGAAVGAASGLNGKDKVEYHQVERKETVIVKGDARLVLGLKDTKTPRVTIEFDPPRLASDWWYKIQSAKA